MTSQTALFYKPLRKLIGGSKGHGTFYKSKEWPENIATVFSRKHIAIREKNNLYNKVISRADMIIPEIN